MNLRMKLLKTNLVSDVPYLYVRALANNLLMDFDYDVSVLKQFCMQTVLDGFAHVTDDDVSALKVDDLMQMDTKFLNGVYVMLMVVDLLDND